MAIQKSPDNFLETWVGIAAIWGAITGTVALAIQLIQHFTDRPKLILRSSMGIKSDDRNPVNHLYVRVETVNNGRRPARIEKVAVILPESTVPIIPKASTLKRVSSQFYLFDAEVAGGFIEISPEGGKHVFESHSFPPNTALAMFQYQKEGKAFVRLTSGKELFTSFCLANPDEWSKLLG